MPIRPRRSASHDSWTRASSGSKPSIVSVQSGSASTSGTSPRRRRSSWSSSSATNVSGPPPRPMTPAGRPRRLRADRDGRGPSGFRDEQEGIAAGKPAEWAELVAGDEHRARSDAAAPKVVEHPARRVGLVRQADLDVLRIARHPCVGQPGLPRSLLARARPPPEGRSGPLRGDGSGPRQGARRSSPSADRPTPAPG